MLVRYCIIDKARPPSLDELSQYSHPSVPSLLAD